MTSPSIASLPLTRCSFARLPAVPVKALCSQAPNEQSLFRSADSSRCKFPIVRLVRISFRCVTGYGKAGLQFSPRHSRVQKNRQQRLRCFDDCRVASLISLRLCRVRDLHFSSRHQNPTSGQSVLRQSEPTQLTRREQAVLAMHAFERRFSKPLMNRCMPISRIDR